MKNLKTKLAVASTAAFATAQSHAADWSAITGAIDFGGEITAVQAIVGLLATVTVVMVGGRKVLSMLRS